MFRKTLLYVILGFSLCMPLMGIGAQEEDPTSKPPVSPNSNSVLEIHDSAHIDWTEGLIKVTGSGAPPDQGSANQRRLLAERAAVADAYRMLAELIHGVRVDSETVVRDFTTESDAIKLQVSGLVKGAQKIDQRYLSDGSVEVDMVVKLYGKNGLSGVIQPQKQRVPPPPLEIKPEEVKEEYTGLIVDCRGLDVKPAMSPAIMNQKGGEVYLGQLPIDPEFVVSSGVVAYSKTLHEARAHERAGKNPLIIRGLVASGNHKTDVLVAEKDARILLGMEQKSKVLSRSKVIFVM